MLHCSLLWTSCLFFSQKVLQYLNNFTKQQPSWEMDDIIFPQWVLRFGQNSVAWCRIICISGKWSKSKPKVNFQYGRRLFFKNASSYISAINWDMSTKFGLLIVFDLLKAAISTHAKPEIVLLRFGRHIALSRWRPLNTISGFAFVDIAAFRRSKSISKPNFVEISQMEAEIFFMVIQNGLGRGQFFFPKSRMCQYPGMLCYILWIQKCIFDACRLSLHNSTPSHCTKKTN